MSESKHWERECAVNGVVHDGVVVKNAKKEKEEEEKGKEEKGEQQEQQEQQEQKKEKRKKDPIRAAAARLMWVNRRGDGTTNGAIWGCAGGEYGCEGEGVGEGGRRGESVCGGPKGGRTGEDS